MKIAIIGTGITGLSAAWLLDQNHDVTIFEANDRVGGHANTVEIDGHPAIDTGFIVFNDWTYPNLLKLFEHLDVSAVESDMSFAVSLNEKKYEYSSNALFSNLSNYFNPKHWWMLIELVRFYRALDKETFEGTETLGKYLKRKRYSNLFAERHIFPMAAAIWSGDPTQIKNFPMKSFYQFFKNHGLLILDVNKRPQWRTVGGGSKTYVDAIANTLKDKINLNTKITDVIRHKDFVEIVQEGGKTEQFEQVVLAVHSDQALKMLARPTEDEKKVLEAFPYKPNQAYLHQDKRLMPKSRKAWASWNFIQSDMGHEPYVTYWMNLLQPFIDRGQNYFVTINPPFEPSNILYQTNYSHPQYGKSALGGWDKIADIQGINRTWFCGAWCGYGFHEDGLSAGLSVAEELGGKDRPWITTDKSPAGENCRPVFD